MPILMNHSLFLQSDRAAKKENVRKETSMTTTMDKEVNFMQQHPNRDKGQRAGRQLTGRIQ